MYPCDFCDCNCLALFLRGTTSDWFDEFGETNLVNLLSILLQSRAIKPIKIIDYICSTVENMFLCDNDSLLPDLATQISPRHSDVFWSHFLVCHLRWNYDVFLTILILFLNSSLRDQFKFFKNPIQSFLLMFLFYIVKKASVCTAQRWSIAAFHPENSKESTETYLTWLLIMSSSQLKVLYTLPIDRIISVKNARAWISMDFK